MKLIQKLFESKLVIQVKSYHNKLVYQQSTEPFFPYIHQINSLKQIFSETDLREIFPEDIIKRLYLTNNKHRMAIPNDISIIKHPETKKMCKEINTNTIIFIPTYKENDLIHIFIVLTNRYNITDEEIIIVNILIDFLSVIHSYLSTRKSLEDILSKITKGILDYNENITSCEILIDTKLNNIISTTCDNETITQIQKVIPLSEVIKLTKNLGMTKLMKSYETEEGDKFLFNILSENLTEERIKINLSKIKYRSEKVEETLIKISDYIRIPIVLSTKNTEDIVKMNYKFKEIFPEYELYSKLQEIKSNLKYISPNNVIKDDYVFSVEEVSTSGTDLKGLFFYPIQIANQKTVMHLYDEAIKIRKILSSINLYESKLSSKNLEIYVRYQLSEQMVEIGGDFFIVKDIGTKSIVGVFDVSGHSLSAGFLSANAKSIIDKSIQEHKNIQKALEDLNNFLSSINDAITDTEIFSYITGIMCEIDIEKMKAKFISAGHKYGVILKEDGITTLSDILPRSKPIGIKKDITFEVFETHINPNDKFFFYTDGIVELETTKGHQVDEAKIIDLIIFCKNLSIRDTIEEIFSYIKGLKEVKVKDDFVILGFKIKT